MKLDCIRNQIPDTIFFYNKDRMRIQEKKWRSALFPDTSPRLPLLKLTEAYG